MDETNVPGSLLFCSQRQSIFLFTYNFIIICNYVTYKIMLHTKNTYNIIYGTSCQSRFDAWYWMLVAGALGRPRGMVWGGRREEGSGWGTHIYLWRIHFDIWQNQYNIVSRVITAPDVVLVTHMQTEGHRHVWCDIRKWTDECAGAQSPASANNGTWGKLLALSKSLHLYYHNLMILVKIKAISQSSCETQILKCFKAFGKVSKTFMGLLR